jgi:hypothetical protein
MIFFVFKKTNEPLFSEKVKKRKLVNKMTTFDKR